MFPGRWNKFRVAYSTFCLKPQHRRALHRGHQQTIFFAVLSSHAFRILRVLPLHYFPPCGWISCSILHGLHRRRVCSMLLPNSASATRPHHSNHSDDGTPRRRKQGKHSPLSSFSRITLSREEEEILPSKGEYAHTIRGEAYQEDESSHLEGPRVQDGS